MKPMQIGIVAAAFLACASTALAQPSAAPAPDPQRLQLAREIMQANGGVEALQAQLKTMFASISRLTQSALPPNFSPQAQTMTDTLTKHMQEEELKGAAAMIDDTAAVYAEHLTVQELKAMLAYAKSADGQTIREKMPAITQDLLLRQGPLIKRMTSGVVRAAVEQTCKDSHCTPEERKTLMAVAEKIAPAS
jgi:hypothetical protein